MSTKKVVLLVIVVIILLIAMSWCTGRQFSKMAGSAQSSVVIGQDSWLRVNPSGMIPDYNEVMPFAFMGKISANSIQNMTLKIRLAKDDSRIKGLILEPGMLQVSFAGLNELGIAIQDFKQSGKAVLAFGDYLTQGDYLLASYADEIYMEPSASAGLLLTGTAVNALFYKDLYQKLGIKMHVIQAGEFKGAGEPYSQTSFSEGTRKNIEAALSDRFDLILNMIVENRGLTRDDALAVYNNRENLFIRAEKAVEMKLVDHALSRANMLDSLATDAEKLVAISDYAPAYHIGKGDKVAVVYLSGNIASGPASYNQSLISHQKVKKIVKDLLKNQSVKAVVLRVNSPGGSALESELIYQELLRLKAEKPILISMGGTAASGGYYISCAADKIIADPGTITGSIGVIMVLPEVSALSNKAGIASQTIKYGKFAGALNPFEPYSDEVLASVKLSSIATYDEFKSRVMAARNISADKINSLAEGRIYSAEDALAVGLVDELGSLDTAISTVAEMAGLSDYETVNYPVKMTFFEALKDSEFLNLSLSSLLKGPHFDPLQMARDYIEHIEPGTWQYLMPVVVE